MYLMLAVIAFGLLSGFEQGMIMIQERDTMSNEVIKPWDAGIRSHRYFGIYHLLRLIILASYSIVFYLILLDTPSIMTGAGLLFLYWELFECGYNHARYAKPVVWYEHINTGDMISIKLEGWKVLILHIARTSAAITLIYYEWIITAITLIYGGFKP